VTITFVSCPADSIEGTIKAVVGTGSWFTVTVEVPNRVASWIEAAFIIALPAATGVNTPLALIAPMFDGVTDHVTALLKLPVPATVGVQVDVWFVRIEAGVQATDTEVIVVGTDTLTVPVPDLVESAELLAVIVACPELGAVDGAV
jgi:hypothetical protein